MASAIRSVLVVDDEQPVRLALGRILEGAGYTVSLAETAEEALAILDRIPVQLLISDNHMPGMPGIDLLKLVRVRYPNIVRIMLTGDADPEIPIRSINEGEVYRFIRKPWNNSDLRTIVYFAFEVIDLEEEKRQLIALMRKQRKARESGSPMDPLDLEAELLLLAEEEAKQD
jgi:DNA-binding NtrC family response regulator